MRGASAARRAAAKVNLYLDVRGRRPDGYHELETLFLEIPWGDEIRVEVQGATAGEVPRVDLVRTGPVEVPDGPGNLAWCAARAFLAAASARADASLPARVRVTLEKRVPAGSGLGGGSADAACVLRLLDELLPGRVAPGGLADLAAGLGADVPFFLVGGAAVGRGRGDRIESVPVAATPDLVLVLPPFGCSTAEVFAAWRAGRPAPANGLAGVVAALRAGDPGRLRAAHHNALAFAALGVHPRLRRFTADVERRLGRAPAMSGSGSALYDVPDVGETEAVVRRLEGLAGQRIVVPGTRDARR